VAESANANPSFSVRATVKSVLDRFKKIQDAFDKKDAAERHMSGVGGFQRRKR